MTAQAEVGGMPFADEGGTMSQGARACRNWKGKETESPPSLQEGPHGQRLDLSLMKLISDFGPPELQVCMVLTTKRAVICYSSHRKLMHASSLGWGFHGSMVCRPGRAPGPPDLSPHL